MTKPRSRASSKTSRQVKSLGQIAFEAGCYDSLTWAGIGKTFKRRMETIAFAVEQAVLSKCAKSDESIWSVSFSGPSPSLSPRRTKTNASKRKKKR